MKGSIDRLYSGLDLFPWVQSISVTAHNPSSIYKELDKHWGIIFIHYDDTCESFQNVDDAVTWIKLKDNEGTM